MQFFEGALSYKDIDDMDMKTFMAFVSYAQQTSKKQQLENSKRLKP